MKDIQDIQPTETIRYCRSENGKNKRFYPNEKKAKWALHKQMDWGARVCRVYKCSKCGGWHLTSAKGDIRKKKKSRKDRRKEGKRKIRGGGGVDWHKGLDF